MRSRSVTFIVVLNLFSWSVAAAETPPANSTLAVDESFDAAELGPKWHVNTGSWKVVDGVLRAAEIPADKHSAAARRTILTGDAVYEFRFRFVDDGKVFHFGFDPAKGELKKKGHLFSVIITPQSCKVMKHVDKNNRKADPNEVLAEKKQVFMKDRWYTLRVTTWQQYVTVKIDGERTLEASHPTFAVKKPTLVFRCIGDGIEIDDIKVWTRNES